jgi:hypothetical protein
MAGFEWFQEQAAESALALPLGGIGMTTSALGNRVEAHHGGVPLGKIRASGKSGCAERAQGDGAKNASVC